MGSAPLIWTALATLGAALVYLGTIVWCGRARVRYAVPAPAVTGDPAFERAFRIQQNTLEQIVLMLPCLWLFSILVSAPVGAALGGVWSLGRILYAVGYARRAGARGPGFMISFGATLILLLGALSGTITHLPL